MDNFSCLSVLISIVLGLGITQILSGFGRWVENRATFPAYAPSILWAVLLLVMHVQTWWSMYGLRQHEHWTFLQFFVVLLQPIVLYLLSSLVLPSQGCAVADLKSNYSAQRSWFFGWLMALLAVSVVRDLALTGALPSNENLAFHLLFLGLAAVGLITASEWVHRVIVLLSAGTIGLYIAFLFYLLD